MTKTTVILCLLSGAFCVFMTTNSAVTKRYVQYSQDSRLNNVIVHGPGVKTYSVSSKVHCGIICAQLNESCDAFLTNGSTCFTCKDRCSSGTFQLMSGFRFYSSQTTTNHKINTGSMLHSFPCLDVTINPNYCYDMHFGNITQVSVGQWGMMAVTSEKYLMYTSNVNPLLPSGWTTVKEVDDVVWVEHGEAWIFVCTVDGLHALSTDPRSGNDWVTLDIPPCTSVVECPNESLRTFATTSNGSAYDVWSKDMMSWRGNLTQLSCGKGGLWTIGRNLTTTGNATDLLVGFRNVNRHENVTRSSEKGWQVVSGVDMVKIEVGYGKVIGVDQNDVIWRRENVSSAHPTGTTWNHTLSHAHYVTFAKNRTMWTVNQSGVVHYYTNIRGDKQSKPISP